ncbi:hypothetical protein [Morganella morganii]|uniref:hypothetical protein n=1 Tax=Morganella morganii TaxID=582 RepID=UPI00061E4134|nr:hypothetical protein [Morganella morganii]KJY06327.1 hypothetical protein Mm0Y_00174 [Morganella morganii]
MTDKLYTYGNTPDKKLPPIYGKDGTHDIASLRDMFAAKAMQGIITTAAAPVLTSLAGLDDDIAQTAYELADAMLRAREK